MPSIFVTPQPVQGRVLIQLNFSDTAATFARVLRQLDDGTTTPVRVNTATNASGDYIELSGGQAIIYDTEMPLDVPLVYIADGLIGSVAAGTATSSPPPGIVVASGSDLWLKAPLRPWADQRLTLIVPSEPDCVPQGALFFQAMDQESRQARSTGMVINNRKNPIWLKRVRAGISSVLSVISRRFVDRDSVIALNQEGDPLFFQGPADYGIPDQYMGVDNYTVSRLTTDHRRQWRAHQMGYTEVDRPAGLAEGVLGNRWDDMCQRYLTFADANAAAITWTSALEGRASNAPTTPQASWLYASIPIQYATYTALNAAFATYTDLWEGPF